MAFLQKLFSPNKYKRQNSSKSSYNDTKIDWKKPQFDGKSIRLVLFQDTNTSGRKLIFDSQAVVRQDDKVCRRGCKPGTKLLSVKEGQVQQNVAAKIMYQSNRASSDSKKLEEIMFGAVGVAYKGTSLKVHVTRAPPQLMLTKVFVPVRPKRTHTMEGEESSSFSSVPDLAMPARSSTLDSREGYGGIAQSVPMDVPSPKQHMMRGVDLIDEDSGLASLTSSGSFYCPSPSSLSDSCNSLNMEKRWHRGQWTSLDKGLERRRSQQDVLAELMSPRKPSKVKFALGIIFDSVDVHSNNTNRLFESFFFSHIALLESHLEHLRQDIEKAYFNRNFYPGVIEAYEVFKHDIIDLYTAPRLSEPVWLNMMSYSSYRYMLCDKFLKEFVTLVNKFDNKNNHFFMSTLVTCVLTHHLAWVPTVMPAGGSPSGSYLEKHSAKWVDTLAKSHPYNPLWAQLGDLYGAIGFPLKLSRTVVVGKRADLVKRLLFILSYFIRCSDILETSEIGSLASYLENVDFNVESPTETHILPVTTPVNEDDQQAMISSPTPVNINPDAYMFKFDCASSEIDPKTFQSMNLDSILDSSGSRQSRDCNSNNRHHSGLIQNCDICDFNSKTENKVGKSVFYVSSDTCLCGAGEQARDNSSVETLDVTSLESERRSEIQKKKETMKLTLILPNQESHLLNSESSGTIKECRLSAAEIMEDAKIERADHHRKCDTSARQREQLQPVKVTLPGYDIKIPGNVNKVLTHDEIRTLFRKEGSNSMFNEYFEEEGIETKTIDDIDKEDRIVDLPTSHKLRIRVQSGDDSLTTRLDDDSAKAPSLPDLTTCGKNEGHRKRLGSLGNVSRQKSSLTRQISESSQKLSKNLPGRCRPVTPTEYGKRRHMSSTSSFDADFLDPRAYCHELPMPSSEQEHGCSSQKDFDKNFGRSLLADFSDHYMSDFVLHGTSDKSYRDKVIRDLQMAMQYSVLDETIAEAVVVVADCDTCKVEVYSSQHLERAPSNFPVPCLPSALISNLIESVVSMAKLKMSPEFCMMHLEDRLQEIYFKSKMMAEYLKKNKNVQDLLAMFGFERSDLPLLAAIAGTHTPNFPLVCLT